MPPPAPSPLALPALAEFESTFAPIVGVRAARDGHAALEDSDGTPQQRIEAAARWLQPHRLLAWRTSPDRQESVLVIPDARFSCTLSYRPNLSDVVIRMALPEVARG